ncbi:stage II sporulation protein D [Lachnospiraceae bacterium XBB1006]|nr:stage II sporulation protein D [Lachnospiraceae bacterium XBB1006]
MGLETSGFSKKQRKQLGSLALLLGMTFLIFCGIVSIQKEQQSEKRELLTQELGSFMSFYEYNAKQWDNYFEKQGYGSKIDGAELLAFCHRLGVSDYIDEDLFSKAGTISYDEFLPIYEQMLSILDTDHLVSTREMKIDGKLCQVYCMEEHIIGFKSFVKKHTISRVLAKEQKHSDSEIVSVALKNGASYYREKLYLKVNAPYKKCMADGKKLKVKKNAMFQFTKSEKVAKPKKKECITLEPTTAGGRVYFTNKSGTVTSRGYRGIIKIYQYSSGYVVVNELTVKEYLYGVLPSEMPSSFEKEALKAQAVCARSYVYRQMEQVNGPAKFYAQIDDSTAYQVYNKSAEASVCNQAVDETANKILKYKGKIATTYYYSTSCGAAQSYEIWKADKNTSGYLQSGLIHEKAKRLGGTKTMPDLSKSKAFRSFIEESDTGYLEKNCRYFRWDANASFADKEVAFLEAVRKRKVASPGSVIIRDSKGNELSDTEKLGKFSKWKISGRYGCGTISEMTVTFEKGTVLLKNEYTIRMCLAALKPTITLQDHSKAGGELLPSACFYIKSQKNKTLKIRGGGFGHGLGLSQNGANELAKKGYNYKKILSFFYQGVTM